jgi:hypothetical protein
VTGVLDVVLDNLPDGNQFLALGGLDPYGLDGPHHYSGLAFAPVPGNPAGLDRVAEAVECLAGEAVRAAGLLEGLCELQWDGADADAFRARIAAVPPVLRRYAMLLRQLVVLVDEARAVLRAGKGRAEALDREAVVARRNVPSFVPTNPALAAVTELPGEVLRSAQRLQELVAEAARLCLETRARLTEIGHEIAALSRDAPHPLGTGAARWVDASADAVGYVDRVHATPLARQLVDGHPEEAHLVASLLGDVAGTLAINPLAYPAALVFSLAGFGLDARIYRTGATNGRGKAVVDRAGYEEAIATAIPVPVLGPGTLPAVRTVAVAVGPADHSRGLTTPDRTRLGAALDTAAELRTPVVSPVAEYLRSKGAAAAPPPVPDVRLSDTPPPGCSVTPGVDAPADRGPRPATARTR